MTFTIPMFWIGVIVTLGAEFLAIVAGAIVKSMKNKNNTKFRRK